MLDGDSVLFREGLTRRLTEAGHQVVAAVGDAELLMAAVTQHWPGFVIVDASVRPEAGSRLRVQRLGCVQSLC